MNNRIHHILHSLLIQYIYSIVGINSKRMLTNQTTGAIPLILHCPVHSPKMITGNERRTVVARLIAIAEGGYDGFIISYHIISHLISFPW